MKDQNFIESRAKIDLDQESKLNLLRILEKDSLFLSTHGLID